MIGVVLVVQEGGNMLEIIICVGIVIVTFVIIFLLVALKILFDKVMDFIRKDI